MTIMLPTRGGKLMRTQIGLLSIAGFLGLLAAAEAALPFDGIYQFYSAAKVSETSVRKRDMGVCPDRQPSPLVVVDGLARYTTETGRNLEGQVAQNGVFEMRFINPDGTAPMHVVGTIDGNDIVRVRQKGNSCSYDFVWQKQS
jgi:hypothetical protein